jgi:hypothetical protein
MRRGQIGWSRGGPSGVLHWQQGHREAIARRNAVNPLRSPELDCGDAFNLAPIGGGKRVGGRCQDRVAGPVHEVCVVHKLEVIAAHKRRPSGSTNGSRPRRAPFGSSWHRDTPELGGLMRAKPVVLAVGRLSVRATLSSLPLAMLAICGWADTALSRCRPVGVRGCAPRGRCGRKSQ